jgi:hypothetical protein
MAMSEGLTVEIEMHTRRVGRGGRKALVSGPAPTALPAGRVPRVSRLMALALSIERRIQAGEIGCYADVARAGNVTRARVTQIVNLTCLAPDIIEAVLHLPRTETGRDRILLKDVLPIAAELDWRVQRLMWKNLLREAGVEPTAE